MTKFKATVSGAIPPNRLLVKGTDVDGITLSAAQPGDVPEFRSTGPLNDGQVVYVTINNAPSWVVEAGEDIAAGDNITVGTDGVAVVATDESFGYAVNNAEEGQLVTVVRVFGGTGGAGGSITSDDITDASAVGKGLLTAADAATARTSINALAADDSRLTAGAAGTATVRAIGTTATTAAAGNHTHTATNITATAISPGTATNVQGILAELAARITELETP